MFAPLYPLTANQRWSISIRSCCCQTLNIGSNCIRIQRMAYTWAFALYLQTFIHVFNPWIMSHDPVAPYFTGEISKLWKVLLHGWNIFFFREWRNCRMHFPRLWIESELVSWREQLNSVLTQIYVRTLSMPTSHFLNLLSPSIKMMCPPHLSQK